MSPFKAENGGSGGGLKRKLSDQENGNGEKAKRPRPGGPADQVEAQRILAQRRALPMFAARRRFLEEMGRHDSAVLVGETGSGKTTQVPQFIHEARLDSDGAVAITQPRRSG